LASFTPTLGQAISILRQRFFIDHASHAKTSAVEEFTIQANENNVRNILLIVPAYMINLAIYDSDKHELPIMSNTDTKNLVTSMIDEASGTTKTELLHIEQDMKDHLKYLLWMQLPESKKLLQNDLCIITLEYDYPKEKKKPKEFMLSFLHEANYVVMYSIRKPDDYEFKKNEITTNDEDGKELKFTGLDNAPENLIYVDHSVNTTNVTIKKDVPNPIQIFYSFKPSWDLIKFPLLVLGVLWISSFALLVFESYCLIYLDCDDKLWKGAKEIHQNTIQLGVAIIAASLVIPTFIHNQSIREDMTKYFLIPIILASMAIFL